MSLAFFGPKPPFQLDQTQAGKPTAATIAITENADVEGQIFLFSRVPKTHGGPATSFRPSLGLAARNVDSAAITNPSGLTAITGGPTYAGASVAMKVATSGVDLDTYVARFGSLSSTTQGGLNYPITHLIPSVGVNAVCWLICSGPSWMATAASGDNDIDAGEFVLPSTVTAGRIEEQDVGVAAGSATFVQLNSAIGRCMIDSGGAAASTALPILVTAR